MPRKSKAKKSKGSTPVVNEPRKMNMKKENNNIRSTGEFLAVNSYQKGSDVSVGIAPVHPMLGVRGTRLVGTQQMIRVNYDQAGITGQYVLNQTPYPDAYAARNFFGGNASMGYGYSIDPSALGGPLSVKTVAHTKYVFRKIRFRYVTETSSIASSSIAMGILADPVRYQDLDNTGGFDKIFTQIKSMSQSVTGPVRENLTLEYRFNGNALWNLTSSAAVDQTNNSLGSASSALSRQETQCMFVGSLDNNNPGTGGTNGTFGYIEVDYVLDLYQEIPVSFNNFTVLRHISDPSKNPIHEFVYGPLRDFLLCEHDDVLKKFMVRLMTNFPTKAKIHPFLLYLSSHGSTTKNTNVFDKVIASLMIEEEKVDEVERIDYFTHVSEPVRSMDVISVCSEDDTYKEKSVSSSKGLVGMVRGMYSK